MHTSLPLPLPPYRNPLDYHIYYYWLSFACLQITVGRFFCQPGFCETQVSNQKKESTHDVRGTAAPIQGTQLDGTQVYVRRRQRSDDACFLSVGGGVKRIAEHKETNVAYCAIPKVCRYISRPMWPIASYPRYVIPKVRHYITRPMWPRASYLKYVSSQWYQSGILHRTQGTSVHRSSVDYFVLCKIRQYMTRSTHSIASYPRHGLTWPTALYWLL